MAQSEQKYQINKRRIPGPANNFDCQQNTVERQPEQQQQQQISEDDKTDDNPQLSSILSNEEMQFYTTELESSILRTKAWLQGCVDNDIAIECRANKLFYSTRNCFVFKSNLRSILTPQTMYLSVFKVPKIMLLVKSIAMETTHSDALAEVVDGFASMKATIARSAFTSYPQIGCGSCLLLQNTTIYQSTQYKWYINIVANNIVNVYPNNVKLPYKLNKIATNFRHAKHAVKPPMFIRPSPVNKYNNQSDNTNIKEPVSVNRKQNYSFLARYPQLITSNSINNAKKSTKKKK
eukprot:525440_1